MATRILFADDQIPDDEIDDAQIKQAIGERYPQAQPGFINAFVKMRKIVSSLRDRNCLVTVANTYNSAIELARREHFDIAIIDLGWFGDHELSRADRGSAGWSISSEIQNANKKSSVHRPTAQIIYSSRFATRPEIGEIASRQGLLPFFKVYREIDSFPTVDGHDDPNEEEVDRDSANRNALSAAVSFIEHLLQDPVDQARQAAVEVLRASENSVERWEKITLFCTVLSVILVAISVVSVVVFNRNVAIVTAIASALTALIPRLFFGQLRATREQLSQAITRVISVSSPSP